MVSSNRFYAGIESSADYYEPSIYSALTFFHTFESKADPLEQEFFPISPAAYRFGESSQKGKLFVVGIRMCC